MVFIHAGSARLDIFTDSLILDIGADTFVVPLARLADLTSHRVNDITVSRRYWGDAPGKFLDVQQGVLLRRSKTGRALMLAMDERIYSIPIWAVLEVKDGIRDVCEISQLVTDARQLDDATSRQTVLEVRT